MFYIYCYTNLINGKKYVGQTHNVVKRKRDHLASSKYEYNKDYNLLFHQKIRQYGIENFSFEILEEIDTEDLEYVDAREIYWIQQKNSYVRNGQGYNLTLGGQFGARRKPTFSDKEFQEIIDLLKNSNLSQLEIANKFGVSAKVICNINTGSTYHSEKFDYPIRKNFIDESTKERIKDLLLNSNMSQPKIANEMGVSLSTVKRIKASLKTSQKPVSTIAG